MGKKLHINPIAEAIQEFLIHDSWEYRFDEKWNVFQFTVRLSGKIKFVNYNVRVTDDEYIVDVACSIGLDEDDTDIKLKMAEFICRVNYGLKTGRFEYNCDDGWISYVVHTCCQDIVPSAAMIRRSIYYPAVMFERYCDGILAMLFTDTSPKEAVEKCEQENGFDIQALFEAGLECDGQSDETEAESCDSDSAAVDSEIRTEIFGKKEEADE